MSSKYKHGDKVPSDELCKRLNELSDAVTKGAQTVAREFDMRIPAELDRDADLVLSEAAMRIAILESQLTAERWLKVSENEPPYGEHILIALQLDGGDWFICYGFVQSDWSLRSIDDECVGYDLDDDAYWKRVQPPIDAALQAAAQEEP